MLGEVASGESAAPESQQTGPGELLRDRRKDRGLSVEQVADELHLGPHIVAALEAEQFADIGAPVFVRGHLKAYARVLRLDEGTVLDAYRASQPDESLEPVLARPTPERRVTINPGPWSMGALGLLLMIALAFYVLQDESPETAAVEPEPETRPPAAARLLPPPEPDEPAVEAPVVAAPPVEVAAVPPVPDEAPVPEAPVADALPAEPAAVVAPPPAAPEPEIETPAVAQGIELEFYFREESWVEISNPERRILFGLQREGMRRQLTGEPPINILLGNAPGVDVYLNKQLYEVPARNINGKVARFVIDASAETSP